MTFILLILILGVLVFVHELGHFVFAKLYKVHVYEFSIGMGPKIFSFRRKDKNDETLYSLRLLPIGGFCAMAGEVEQDDDELDADDFMCNKSKKEQFLILAGGVLFNFVLAIVLLFTMSLIWGHTSTDPIVGLAPKGLPVHDAGIRVGDEVVKLNGHKITSWDKLNVVLNLKTKDGLYNFEVRKKNGGIEKYTISPVEENDRLVFGIGGDTEIKKGLFSSLLFAFKKFGILISTMMLTITSLITGKLSTDLLSGPVGLYSIVGTAQKAGGLINIIFLTAALSVNLGFINAIPFPAFDGGRLVFLIYEAITKKEVNKSFENTLHTIGFILLMILMLYITVKDIIKLI